MKLSFVIPARNEEKRIGHCLDAIMQELDRTLHHSPHDEPRDRDVEIVVVNNASTDNTKAAVLKYPGVRVVDEPEPGIVKARARGFTSSDGELVANVDADGLLPPGWLERVFTEFERDPRLVCLSGPLVYYDLSAKDQFMTQMFYWLGFTTHLIFRFFKIGAIVQGGNFIVRRSAWEAAGGFDTSIDFYGEDTDVGRRIVKHGKVKFSFYLPILSSGRRLVREGVLAIGTRYALNYFWMIFTGHPYTRTSEHTRAPLAHK